MCHLSTTPRYQIELRNPLISVNLILLPFLFEGMTRNVKVYDTYNAPEFTPGDFNGDGNVDTADYTIWADNYTGSGGTGGTPSTGDANGDGAVDTADYTIWADNYTGPSSSAGSVPEPSTACLLLSMMAIALTIWALRLGANRHDL